MDTYLDVTADGDRDLIKLAEAVPVTALDSLGPGGRWSTQALTTVLAPIPFQSSNQGFPESDSIYAFVG